MFYKNHKKNPKKENKNDFLYLFSFLLYFIIFFSAFSTARAQTPAEKDTQIPQKSNENTEESQQNELDAIQDSWLQKIQNIPQDQENPSPESNPNNQESPAQNEAPTFLSSAFRFFIATTFLLLLFYLFMTYARKKLPINHNIPNASFRQNENELVQTLFSTPLSNTLGSSPKSLQIIKVVDKYLVLAITDKNIELIDTIEEQHRLHKIQIWESELERQNQNPSSRQSKLWWQQVLESIRGLIIGKSKNRSLWKKDAKNTYSFQKNLQKSLHSSVANTNEASPHLGPSPKNPQLEEQIKDAAISEKQNQREITNLKQLLQKQKNRLQNLSNQKEPN